MKNLFTVIAMISMSLPAFAVTGPYVSKVNRIQALNGSSSPLNGIYLDFDVADSPCSGTNQHNRFFSDTESQYSTVLAALLAGKDVEIYGAGVCDGVTEKIAYVVVRSNS